MNNLRTDSHNADIFMHVSQTTDSHAFVQNNNAIVTKKSPTTIGSGLNSQRAPGLQKRAFGDDLLKHNNQQQLHSLLPGSLPTNHHYLLHPIGSTTASTQQHNQTKENAASRSTSEPSAPSLTNKSIDYVTN